MLDKRMKDLRRIFNLSQIIQAKVHLWRKKANLQYENIIANRMTLIVKKVQNEIYDKCNIKQIDDED